MFVRKVATRLKPGAQDEFVRMMEQQVLPWLRQQEGFLDLIILVAPDQSEIATLSFWREQAYAENYAVAGYPEVLSLLEKLLDARPYVKTFEVVSSSMEKLSPGATGGQEHSVRDTVSRTLFRPYEANV